MKRFLLFTIILFAIKFLFSQTVLTNDLNLSLGDTYRYDGYEESSNIEPGNSGTNQTWDFSQVTGSMFIEGDQNICVEPSTTPFADSSAVSGANICVRNVEEDVSPYQYFDCGNSKMDLLAMGFVAETNGSFTTYINSLTAMNYPFGYGDNYNDTWELITFHIDFGFYMMRDSAEVMVEADASGTITTPTDTYQNCLRIKRTTTYYSWFKFTEGGDWIPSGPFTDFAYEWYAPGIKVPVMIIDEMDGFPDYSVRYLVDYNFITGIHANNEMKLEIYPNPASDMININSDKAISQIDVFTIEGKKLLEVPLESSMHHQIRVNELAFGTYILSVLFEDGTRSTKNVIKK